MSLPINYAYYDADKKLVGVDLTTNVRSRIAPKDDGLKAEALRALFKLAGEAGSSKALRVRFVGVSLAGQKPAVVTLQEVADYAAKENAKFGAFPPAKYDEQKRAVVERAFPALKAAR